MKKFFCPTTGDGTSSCTFLAQKKTNDHSDSYYIYYPGLGLLFSAGTMIYTITTHLLPELLKKSPHHHPPESRDMKDCKIEDNDKDEDPTVLQVLELCTFVVLF
mmetsp:Transcript_9021/g.14622  ORF Transcript_9021/g.14622 Transcript_9021/m.14622 type:complete len:104 (-) Transcript_9021:416-727(-)